MKYTVYFLVAFLLLIFKNKTSNAQIVTLDSRSSFRALHILSDKNIWVSGSNGSLLVSYDGGKHWKNTCPILYKNFDFRGIFAINKNTILAMSSGNAEDGKAILLKTTNSGESWNKVYESKEKGVFFDAIKFIDAKTGFVLGDAIDSKPYLLKTMDSGNSWFRIENKNFPDILKGEASFAASNSCLSTYKKNVWFNTQNRIFQSTNKGKTWKVTETPFESGNSKGIFGIYFKNELEGIAVGGDYKDTLTSNLQTAFTINGAKTWETKNLSYAPGLSECTFLTENGKICIASLQGIRISDNNGLSYKVIDKTPFHVIACLKNTCFAAGGNGKIGKWEF